MSLVIPAYNEAARLPGTLHRVLGYLKRQPYRWELIVVDDGSTDDTAGICETHEPVRLIRNKVNMGKGYSVARGMLAARGERVIFTDADLAAPVEEIKKILVALDCADVAIGRRQTRVDQGITRETLGKLFAYLTRMITGLPFTDTQCGLKGFTLDAARAVFPRLTCRRFAFDVEALMLAQKLGLKVAEIPVAWRHVPGSKVSPVNDGWQMLKDTWRIRRELGELRAGDAVRPAGIGGAVMHEVGGDRL
ncbi:hypothetical protein A6M21_07580 [Desulfotomaculum copahuensis]|uniref:dolichyl-phosphate beta-glucosyltransferase n=1 Tax=Desulfotomaculum copahuensis TaxID=1838280 RepID=A0A1B7LGB1_9FIRM|nr:hypothetical protein A6M21_07580 [Desulfotomaculum copahuensis]